MTTDPTFPGLATASRRGEFPHEEDVGRASSRRVNILLVDDEPNKALAIQSVVDELNHHLVVATSGEAGLRELLEREYSLVLLDIHMPGMDGFEMARLIRSRPSYSNLAIVFISSADQTDERLDRAYELGAIDFISMPARRPLLRAKISSILALQQERGRRHEQPTDAAASTAPETARLRLLLSNAKDLAIAFLDLKGNIVEWSCGAELTFGWVRSEAVGNPISLIFTPEDAAGLAPQKSLAEALAGREAIAERWYQRRDGTRFWGNARTIALLDPAHRGFAVLLRDMTAHKNTEDDLKQRVSERTAQLEEVVGELEAFSYTISHDLQAPLRAIRAYAEAVSDDFQDALGPPGLQQMQRIKAATARLEKLIEDVLNYCRVPRDQIVLAPVDVAKIVRENAEQSPALQPPNARILIQEPLSLVMGSAPLLTQVFSNLLSNAIKFVRPDQCPTVLLRTENVGTDVLLWVEDNGVGINPADQERIFEMFERAHYQHDFKGTGIGLAIVRKAVQRMGGSAGVESQPGAGSRFWVRLRKG